MSDNPFILLGLDAGDIVLIEAWASQGRLPAFASLLNDAAHGRLETPAAILQGSIWPSFATACNPGKHGSYFMMQMRNGSNEVMRTRADHLLRPPFWSWFEGPDETAVVIDVPKMQPLEDINGIQVVEWGTTDHYAAFTTVPADFARPILRRFGKHPLLQAYRSPHDAVSCLRLKDRLLRGIAMKHQMHKEFIEAHQPRVLVSVFGETHPAGHHFWRFWDQHHPDYDWHPEASQALFDIYAAIDQAIGEIFQTYRHRANCFVFSGHGMMADYHPHAILDDLLRRMELTVSTDSLSEDRLSGVQSSYASRLGALSQVVPQPFKRFANRYILPDRMQEYFMLAKVFRDIDFSKTQAFALPTDLQGFIRLNLRGREPQGTVNPGDYDAVCDDIEQALDGLENPATGEKVVASVIRPRTFYEGAENLDQLPDLCVVWTNESAVTEVYSPQYGVFSVTQKHPERSGNHRPEGFFFAAGPDIDATVQNYRGDLCDIAASVFHLMNKPIPDDWDGTPLPISAPSSVY